MKTVLKESADCTTRRRCRARRKKWMSDETWHTIEKRRETKPSSEAGRVDDREVELARAEFWSLHSEVRDWPKEIKEDR